MKDFSYIAIHYDEMNDAPQETYAGVYVIGNDDTKKVFFTGDVVSDFKQAIHWIRETYGNTEIAYSSSVDDFLMDGFKYRYDKNMMIKKNSLKEQARLKREYESENDAK